MIPGNHSHLTLAWGQQIIREQRVESRSKCIKGLTHVLAHDSAQCVLDRARPRVSPPLGSWAGEVGKLWVTDRHPSCFWDVIHVGALGADYLKRKWFLQVESLPGPCSINKVQYLKNLTLIQFEWKTRRSETWSHNFIVVSFCPEKKCALFVLARRWWMMIINAMPRHCFFRCKQTEAKY